MGIPILGNWLFSLTATQAKQVGKLRGVTIKYVFMRYAICHRCGRFHIGLYTCVCKRKCARPKFSYSMVSRSTVYSYCYHIIVIILPIVVATVRTIHFSLFPLGHSYMHVMLCAVCMTFHAEGNVFQAVAACGMPVFSHNITNAPHTLTLLKPKQTYYRSCITGCVDYDIGEMKFTPVTLLNAFDDNNNSQCSTWYGRMWNWWLGWGGHCACHSMGAN